MNYFIWTECIGCPEIGNIAIKSFYKKDSNCIPVEYLQSMNYLMSEQHDKALDSFMSMVNLNNDTVETHIILGNMFRNRGEVDRAIRIHQNLIARPELQPKLRQECSLELAKDYLKSGFLGNSTGKSSIGTVRVFPSSL